MKAFILADEINHFHWTMLKSVLFILSLLPMSQAILSVWHATQGSSQIMVGFFAISIWSAMSVLCFWSALQATVLKLKSQQHSAREQIVIKVYGSIPMLFLAAIISYLVTQR
jgi:hypothetical protein